MRRQRMALLVLAALVCGLPEVAFAADPSISTDITRTSITLALLAVIPTILVAMTGFTRIVIVLSMIRHAFGMPETPPNSVLVSLALFLTLFAMGPVVGEVNRQAVEPYLAGKMALETAAERGGEPLKRFMLAQTRDTDLAAIYQVAREPLPAKPEQVEMLKLVPAFMINELRTAFTIGFVILLPFLLIDLVVSSILLALGMMMVPPTTISLPIKLLMFVLVDGWSLMIVGVMGSFR